MSYKPKACYIIRFNDLTVETRLKIFDDIYERVREGLSDEEIESMGDANADAYCMKAASKACDAWATEICLEMRLV